MVMLPDARAPEGMRLYAIGDVHGCSDLLVETHRRIAQDLERRPVEDWRVVHIGDYIDRGPDSAGVLSMLMEYAKDPHAEILLGNHDQYLRDFLKFPDRDDFQMWMANGGSTTLDSLGLDGEEMMRESWMADMSDYSDRVRAAATEGLPEFLDGLTLWVQHGDYAFVHAGIAPGEPLDEQSDHDMVWMREPFLSSDMDHGAVIVHGHTPTENVEFRPNRIGIDTGAVFSGVLSCLVLEDDQQHLLGEGGIAEIRS